MNLGFETLTSKYRASNPREVTVGIALTIYIYIYIYIYTCVSTILYYIIVYYIILYTLYDSIWVDFICYFLDAASGPMLLSERST